MASRSLVGRWLRTTLLLLVLMGAGATALFFVHGRRGDADALLRALPAESGNVVLARNLDGLLEAMNRIAAQPGAPDELKQFRRDLHVQSQSELGFDASELDGWHGAGLDLGGVWALAASGLEGDVYSFAYLPIADESAARNLIRKSLEAQGAKLEASARDGLTVTRVTWSPTARPGPYQARAFAVAGDHLVIATSLEVADAEAALRKQLATHGLDQNASFRAVRESLGESWTLFAYSSPALIHQQLAVQHAEGALGPFAAKGAGGALEISDQKIELRVRALGDSTQMPSALATPKPPNDHAGGNPLLAARMSLDLQALVAGMKKDAQGQQQLDSAQRELALVGLDLQKDLLDALDGQLTLGLLPLEQHEAGLIDGVAAFGAKNAPALLEKLAPALAKLGIRPDGNGWLVGMGLSLGATNDALVILGASPERRVAMKKSVGSGGPPFFAALPDEQHHAFESGPALYAYADLERAAESVRHAAVPGAAQGARLLGALQSASMGLDARDGVLRFDADLFPPTGGFGRAIASARTDGGP